MHARTRTLPCGPPHHPHPTHTTLARGQDEAPLLTPHILICSVGTEVFFLQHPQRQHVSDGAGSKQQARPCYVAAADWEASLDEGWDRAAIQQLLTTEFPQLAPQVSESL